MILKIAVLIAAALFAAQGFKASDPYISGTLYFIGACYFGCFWACSKD
jgi:hypothetical protein